MLVSFFVNAKNISDTLLLLNGEKLLINSFKIDEKHQNLIYETFKGKKINIEIEEVFSIKSNSNKEQILYTGEQFTHAPSIGEMRKYIAGENAALNNYKPTFVGISSFIVGAASPFILGAYSPILPLGYGFGISSIQPNPSKHTSSKDHFYLKGYGNTMSNKRKKSAFICGGVGFLVSIVVQLFIIK